MMSSSGKAAWLVVAAAVVVHAGVLGVASLRLGGVDAYAFGSVDATEYHAIAQHVFSDGVFSQSGVDPYVPDTWRTPGYPLFLAGVMEVVGDAPAALIVVHQVLGVASTWLLFGIARASIGTRRGLVVACLFLLEPFHHFYSLWLMSVTLFVTLLLLLWRVWQVACGRPRLGWCAFMGVLAGALVLVRPAGILVPLVVGVALLAKLGSWARQTCRTSTSGEGDDSARQAGGGREGSLPWRVAACVGVYGLCVAVVLGSWMVRNKVVAGHAALAHQGGIVLAYFKATEVELWRQGRSADRYMQTTLDPARADVPHTVWDQIDARLRARFSAKGYEETDPLRWPNLAQGNRTSFDSFEVASELGVIGRDILLASPVATATCCTVRAVGLLTFPLNLALRPPTGVAVSRLTSVVKAGPYLALCLWVMINLLRGAWRSRHVLFPLAATLALLLTVTPQLDPRFRVPMIPLLLLVALIPAGKKGIDA